MSRRTAVVVGLLILGALPASAGARNVRPRAFASCASLISYAQRHFAVTHGVPDPVLAPVDQPTVFGGPVTTNAQATPQAAGNTTTPSFSTTNVQEPGVDEPDTVKTDGRTIFAVSQQSLYAVAVSGGVPKLIGSLGIGSYGSRLLLRGTRLIVISGGPALVAGGPLASIAPSPYYYPGKTIITEVDVHDPSAMKVTRTMTVDGRFVDARQNGGSARLVIASAPLAIADRQARAATRGWIPARRFHSLLSGRRYARPVASCRSVARPADFSGLGMLTILTLDLDRGLWAADSRSVMADAQIVYGSPSSLYVATQRWLVPREGVDQLPTSQTTVIDRFDATSSSHTTFAAAGEVPGYLLNQFSLSEYNGYLRAATTSRPIWWGPGPPQALSQSYVTVLAQRGDQLVAVGQVAGLGLGQQIYSVRFVGDAGYVVTYKQVDPLYALDLSSPTAPKVAGALELRGYSSYLHPLGDGLLLGVGQDVATQINEPSGAQLELFDVSRAAAPRLLAKTTLGAGSSSQVQYDHHAFLFWPPTGLAVLPVQIYGGPVLVAPTPASGSTFVGAIGFHIDRTGIAEVGRVTHDATASGYTPPINRSVVIGDQLFTVSDGGVMASALATLARQGFAAFPTATPPPVVPAIAQAR
jgi:hypothetical protein